MKYLILGDGQLGTELHKQTGWDYISRKKDNIDFVNTKSYFHKVFAKTFKDPNYDVLINCIAHTDTIHNEKEPHWSVNYKAVINLVNKCNLHGIKLVHISSDYIYANSKPEASEKDVPVHLGNWYSYTKLLADGYVQAECKDYLLIRTTFRPNPFPYKKAWLDHLTNADYVDIIAGKIIALIYTEKSGVFNIGTELKTLFDLAKQTNEKCEPMMDDHKYLRPQDVTMNIDKLKKIIR